MIQAKTWIHQGDLASARSALEKVLEGNPGHAAASGMLIEVHLLAGNPGLAHQEEIRQALFVRGITGPNADCYRAHAALLYGDMPKGWDLYESRLLVPGLTMPERHFTHPRWDGKPFPGKTLLLHYEQGLGDTLMFVRFASQVKALGGTVILAAQKSLAELVATCEGIDVVVPRGSPPPPFDLHFPLLSLPWLLRTDLTSIPDEIPYLRVPVQVPNRQRIAGVLAASEGMIRVGLVWQGSPDHPRDSERSIPSASLLPLDALPGVVWYSFQREEVLEVPFPDILPLGHLMSNFSDTAYALSAMDLVITVDTATAHLAGALGVPTLLLVTSVPDWRWMMNRDDSPWYPSLRLYRQPKPGDWDAVVQSVLSDLMKGNE
jgi:hypothetical protein